ncbi:MAG: HD-GYP domain-containing protein [Clostridium sp.]|uniref:HD-GYP domain-containing protein n=1 Tax=Clostridium sp. TaxID=1506 RepID=UPI003F39CD81
MKKRKENKILIIDDLAENIKVLIEILKDDYKINVALSGKKGIELAKVWKPDLILLDIMMPEIDGYEVCRILKNDDEAKDIPIIFLTALGDEKEEYKGISLGAIDYIRKPVNPKLVRARIENHIKLKTYSTELEERVREKVEEVEQFNNSFIETLAYIAETRDADLGKHIDRCKAYATVMLDYIFKYNKFADEIKKEDREIIIKAVPLHDIGKIGIPDKILLKPDRLTIEEFDIMKTHSDFGYKILKMAEEKLVNKKNKMLHCAEEIAYYHHERWDGKGYPCGLKGNEIPIVARIMSIVDVFDAIVSKRVYKDSLSTAVAIEFIQAERGKAFDPELVDIFIELREEFKEIEKKL